MAWFKEKRIKDKAYLKWVGGLPCLVTGKSDSTICGHHLLKTGKRGVGLKSPDNYVIPLCHDAHYMVHAFDETLYLSENGIDNPVELANTLYGLFCNKEYEAALQLVLSKGK